MDAPAVGSLVVPSPRFRRQMGTGEGAAIMLATRRGSALIFYAAADRGYWVPMGQIAAIPAEAVPEDCLERLLRTVLLYVQAEECEIEEFIREEDGCRLKIAVRTPSLTRAQWNELSSQLEPMLADAVFDPRSMTSILLRLELVGAPLPAA